MWIYVQQTGELIDRHGEVAGIGYAGIGVGRNNPAMQDVQDVGPLPCGRYTIGAPYDTETHGPYVLRLTPSPRNQMAGRSGFLMHGDSTKHPGMASDGCIVQARWVRERVYMSADLQLLVVANHEGIPQ